MDYRQKLFPRFVPSAVCFICRNVLNINFSLNIQGHLVGAGMFSDV